MTRIRSKFLDLGCKSIGSHRVALASTLSFNSSIAKAIRRTDLQRAEQIFEELKRSRCQADAVTYSLLMKSCTRDQWWKVLDYLAQVQAVKHDIIPYGASVSFLNKAAQWQASLGVLQGNQFGRMDQGMFAAAFTACRLGACWELSVSFLQKALSSRVPLDDVSCNGLVSALVRGKNDVSTAIELAQNVANFNSILMSLPTGQTGQRDKISVLPWAWALQILEIMRSRGLVPTLGTFKAAASASKDRPEMVQRLLEILKLMGAPSQLDATSLNMLVSSLERCHRWQDALFHLYGLYGSVQADLAAYNSVVSACAKVARWKEALEVVADIQAQHLKMDEVTLGSLVSACHRGHWNLALQILHRGQEQNIRPNQIMVHSAVVACEGQHWPWSLYLLEQSMSWRVIPDSNLLGAIMSSCEKGHQWAHCLHLLSAAFRWQCSPDLAMLTTSISACSKSHRWEATLELFSQLLTFWRWLPDTVTTYAAMAAFTGRPLRRDQPFAAGAAWNSDGTQRYLAEDLVDLRDLPLPLARVAMRDLSNEAFVSAFNIGRSTNATFQDSAGKVQGFLEELGATARCVQSGADES